MLLLALCLVGTAMALPAIPEPPALPEGIAGPVLIPYPHVFTAYRALPELGPFAPLEFKIEPEPKGDEENAEPNPEPSPELSEEPKEGLGPIPPAPELPKPLDPESVIVKLDLNPVNFLNEWINKVLAILHLNNANRYMYPGYAVIVDTKP